MGYTRIEPLPGGAAIPIRQTWRMHKGNDGRKRITVLSRRQDSEAVTRLHREPDTAKKGSGTFDVPGKEERKRKNRSEKRARETKVPRT